VNVRLEIVNLTVVNLHLVIGRVSHCEVVVILVVGFRLLTDPSLARHDGYVRLGLLLLLYLVAERNERIESF